MWKERLTASSCSNMQLCRSSSCSRYLTAYAAARICDAGFEVIFSRYDRLKFMRIAKGSDMIALFTPDSLCEREVLRCMVIVFRTECVDVALWLKLQGARSDTKKVARVQPYCPIE